MAASDWKINFSGNYFGKLWFSQCGKLSKYRENVRTVGGPQATEPVVPAPVTAD